jgi:hypothetical protein
MCKAPKPPAPKEPDKPEFLRNRYLDAAIGQSGVVNQLRQGRSTFRIDLDSGLGVGARQPGESLVPATPATPQTPAAVAPPVRSIAQRRDGGRRAEIR